MNMLLVAGKTGFLDLLGSFFRSVGASFVSFSVTDAVDILFVAVLMFLLFRFLRGRKAGGLLLGILVCFGIYGISYFFELTATHFIFSSIFRFGALAIIILFQPELRDALERIGNESFSGILSFGEQKKKKQLYVKAIDNICMAVGDLSKSETGALIVIERSTRLDEITGTGISINADVNSFLLRNLFFNKAPLHDGAVVITDGRIAAAGCLLPLTRRTDVESDLGTRHRAAIGMSEISDAVTVVVSEETGIISVAYDSELIRGFTPDSLRRYLMQKIVRSYGAENSNN